jgi:hypothetical protein
MVYCKQEILLGIVIMAVAVRRKFYLIKIQAVINPTAAAKARHQLTVT